MLTFEKILKVFQAYLDDDPLYEVVQTSHGYTLMAWEPHRNDWYSAEIQKPGGFTERFVGYIRQLSGR